MYVCIYVCIICVHRDCLLRIVTRLQAVQPRNIAVRFPAGARDVFSSIKGSRVALDRSQLPIQRVPGTFSPWVKRLEREASRLAHGPHLSSMIIAYELAVRYRCAQSRTEGRASRAAARDANL